MKVLRRAALAATLATLVHGSAMGAGFAVYEQSVRGLGTTFAGGSAEANDSSTVFWNPAGLTRLPDGEMQLGAHAIVPTTDFLDAGSALNPTLTGGVAVPGSLRGGNADGGKDAVVPNFYYSRALGQRLFFGLGVNAPFGLSTEYNTAWTGRYHAVESELLTININPALAFKATDSFSVGVGLNAQYADATLSNALDQSTLCLARVGPAGCAGLGLATPGSTATDGFQELTADDWSYGWNVGLLFELNEGTRFGAHYRSRITHDLEGKIDFSGTNVLAGAFAAAAPGTLVDQGAATKITLPETLSLSAYHKVNDSWAVMADATYTRWEHLDVVTILFDAGNAPLNLTLNWENTWRLALGVEHFLNDRWTLRAGVAYDESPTPDFVDRSARVPDVDRVWTGVGASYHYSENLSFDVGYVHLFVGDARIRNADPTTRHLLTGTYDATVEIVSGQLNWRF